MTQTPDRGPETELQATAEDQRQGQEPEDLLRDTEVEQSNRARELRRDQERHDEPS